MAKTEVEITAVDRTAAAFRSVTGGLQKLGRQVLSAQSALFALAGVGGLGLLVKNAFDAGDATAKLSDRLGISTEKLAGLQHAANLAGVDTDKVTLAMRGLTKGVIDAAQGTGEMQQAFNRLGLSADQLARMPLDQQFMKVGEALMRVQNVTERNALAMQIFGSRASEVLNIFAEGGLREAQDDVEKMGVALSRVDAAKIEMANDAMSRAKLAIQGVANSIALALAPIITELANRFADAAKQTNGFRSETLDAMESVATAIAYVANVVHGVEIALLGLRIAIRSISISILDFLSTIDAAYTDFYNKIADTSVGRRLGMEVKGYSVEITRLLGEAEVGMVDLQAQLFKLVTDGFPAARVEKFFADVNARIQATAEKLAAARAGMGVGGEVGGEFTKEDEQLNASRIKLDQYYGDRLKKIQDSFLSEQELKQQQLEQELSIIEANRALERIGDEEAMRLIEEARLRHQARLGDIDAQGILARRRFAELTDKEKLKVVTSFGVQELQAVANTNKTLFNLHKAFVLADIAVTAPGAIAQAVAKAGGLPWGAWAGILTGAKYVALAAQAASANFGSSTSPANISGGGAIPVTPVAPVPALPQSPAASENSGPQITVIIEGHYFGIAESAEALAETIRQRIRDNDEILIDPGSRQAALLGT